MRLCLGLPEGREHHGGASVKRAGAFRVPGCVTVTIGGSEVLFVQRGDTERSTSPLPERRCAQVRYGRHSLFRLSSGIYGRQLWHVFARSCRVLDVYLTMVPY